VDCLTWLLEWIVFQVYAMTSDISGATETISAGLRDPAAQNYAALRGMPRAEPTGASHPAPMVVAASSNPLLRAVRRRRQTEAAPSNNSLSSLFRQEVVEFQEIERQFGRAILLQPVSLKVITWSLSIFVVLILSLLVIGQYSRKATVSGYLSPASGTAKILALQRGTITKIHVIEGQEVEEQQPLLTIDTTQFSATGDDINRAILTTLTSQRAELNSRIAGEARREASERDRLTDLIRGLKDQINQLEDQIPLQQDRIKITESLLAAVSQLAAKGIVTNVEFKRRQAEVLVQKQNLNSLKQDLAARQNQLTDTQYDLNQLPIVIAEKTQLLRNELSSVEQRIAEIDGRRAFVIRAPIAGRVSTLQASTGKLAEPNQLQLEIVPTSTLRAELLVPSRAIGFVRVGQPVSIRYEAFPYQNFGRYQGTITEISHNILARSDVSSPLTTAEEPVYRVTAALDRQDITAYGKRMPLQAGMLLKGDVILDRRSLMQWVLDPLLSVRG
jgi:membrane fusion protein